MAGVTQPRTMKKMFSLLHLQVWSFLGLGAY